MIEKVFLERNLTQQEKSNIFVMVNEIWIASVDWINIDFLSWKSL